MLCAVPSRLPKMRGDINVKDAGRDASCLSHTSPRRAWDRSAVCLGFLARACVCSRADLSVFAGTHEEAQVRMEGCAIHVLRATGHRPAPACLLVSYMPLALLERRGQI